MKKEGRTKLICTKTLSNGIVERFEVVVTSNEKDVSKKNYESRGYHVSIKK